MTYVFLQQKYFPPVRDGNSLIVQQSFKHGAERGDIINQGKLGNLLGNCCVKFDSGFFPPQNLTSGDLEAGGF